MSLGRGGGLNLDVEEARRVLDFLTESMELTQRKLIRLVTRRPALLANEASVRENVSVLKAAGMTPRDIQVIAIKWPGLLQWHPGARSV